MYFAEKILYSLEHSVNFQISKVVWYGEQEFLTFIQVSSSFDSDPFRKLVM
jgi:hypothetical protein